MANSDFTHIQITFYDIRKNIFAFLFSVQNIIISTFQEQVHSWHRCCMSNLLNLHF